MDHRYAVVAGASLVQFTTIGLMFSFGLFFEVFEQEFGWTRTVLSAATATAFFMMGTLAIVAGRVADRFGPRIVIGIAGVGFGTGYMLISQVGEPWQLLLLFATLIGLGLSTHDVVTLSTIARWFDKRRGVMTAVVKVGTAFGQFTIPPLAALLIVTEGWRAAIVMLGIGGGVMILCAALLIKAPPKPAGNSPSGEVAGVSFAEARQSSTFWRLCAIQFLFFPTLMTVPLHIVVHGTDLGMTLETAATLLSVMAAASVAGRLVVGGLSDKLGGRRAYVLCFLPLIASLVALVFVREPAFLFASIALYGAAHGGFFTVVSPTVAEFFGLRAHGAIFGVILFFGTLGGSVGPILAGRVFDLTGSYDPAFITLAGMAALGLVLAATLRRPAGRYS
ncbi:MAG: MFS transporter [Pseudomonadota bacterium]